MPPAGRLDSQLDTLDVHMPHEGVWTADRGPTLSRKAYDLWAMVRRSSLGWDNTGRARSFNDTNQVRTRRARLFVVGLILAYLRWSSRVSPWPGTAESFAVLAGSGVTNTGLTVINGNLGACPTPAVTGFLLEVVAGIIHVEDVVCLQASPT